MTPERLDQIRTIYRVSRLAAPETAVTKALEELITAVESAIGLQDLLYQQQMAQSSGHSLGQQFGLGQQAMAQQQLTNQYRSQLLGQQRRTLATEMALRKLIKP